MSGKLFLVGTPIGNLGDLSPRGEQALRDADFIAAEDTRVTMKLLNHFDIRKPLVSYFEHNKYASGAKILERIIAGENCALVTDAGMPAISDPGEELVRMCAESGVEVLVVPGPAALVSAVALSALPSGRFCFEGFLSTASTNSPLGGVAEKYSTASPSVVRIVCSWSFVSSRHSAMRRSAPKVAFMSSSVRMSLCGAS